MELAGKVVDAKPDELKNVAFTGQKRLEVTDGRELRTVEWTQARQPSFDAFSKLAIGIAATLMAGESFKHDLRYNRMQLDQDMLGWQRQLTTGSASNPEIIQALLEQIANDPQVLARVRRAAATALSNSGH